MSKDLECPYCDEQLEVCHDDGQGYEEGVKHHMECSNCEKSFVFRTYVIFHYEPEKADCLNGAEHEWGPTLTWPREHTKMECGGCGEVRIPTDEEMKEILAK